MIWWEIFNTLWTQLYILCKNNARYKQISSFTGSLSAFRTINLIWYKLWDRSLRGWRCVPKSSDEADDYLLVIKLHDTTKDITAPTQGLEYLQIRKYMYNNEPLKCLKDSIWDTSLNKHSTIKMAMSDIASGRMELTTRSNRLGLTRPQYSRFLLYG